MQKLSLNHAGKFYATNPVALSYGKRQGYENTPGILPFPRHCELAQMCRKRNTVWIHENGNKLRADACKSITTVRIPCQTAKKLNPKNLRDPADKYSIQYVVEIVTTTHTFCMGPHTEHMTNYERPKLRFKEV
jgi:hypothetical protein